MNARCTAPKQGHKDEHARAQCPACSPKPSQAATVGAPPVLQPPPISPEHGPETVDDLTARADALSAGYRVYGTGLEAARLYREAARLRREEVAQGVYPPDSLHAYRALQWEDMADWCEETFRKGSQE